MYQYPKELKESITARMLPPNNVGVPELVQETGIPKIPYIPGAVRHARERFRNKQLVVGS